MSIFSLHARVISDYRDFVQSYFDIADDRAREYVKRALDEEKRLWPDFLLQVTPSYPRVATVDELVSRGVLHASTIATGVSGARPASISCCAMPGALSRPM